MDTETSKTRDELRNEACIIVQAVSLLVVRTAKQLDADIVRGSGYAAKTTAAKLAAQVSVVTEQRENLDRY